MVNGVDLGTREVRHTLRPADCDEADPRSADRPEFAAYCEGVKEWRADVAKLRELFTADEIEKEWSGALDASAGAWSAVAEADKIDLCMRPCSGARGQHGTASRGGRSPSSSFCADMIMASRHIDAGRASALPLHLLAQAIPMLTRNELASPTERLIECLDEQDGDPDLKDDDPSASATRTGWHRDTVSSIARPRGCPISDPGGREPNQH